jgi:hypothetical protein
LLETGWGRLIFILDKKYFFVGLLPLFGWIGEYLFFIALLRLCLKR